MMELYQEVKTAVQIGGKKTVWFEVKFGVIKAQSVLSLLRFAILLWTL